MLRNYGDRSTARPKDRFRIRIRQVLNQITQVVSGKGRFVEENSRTKQSQKGKDGKQDKKVKTVKKGQKVQQIRRIAEVFQTGSTNRESKFGQRFQRSLKSKSSQIQGSGTQHLHRKEDILWLLIKIKQVYYCSTSTRRRTSRILHFRTSQESSGTRYFSIFLSRIGGAYYVHNQRNWKGKLLSIFLIIALNQLSQLVFPKIAWMDALNSTIQFEGPMKSRIHEGRLSSKSGYSGNSGGDPAKTEIQNDPHCTKNT